MTSELPALPIRTAVGSEVQVTKSLQSQHSWEDDNHDRHLWRQLGNLARLLRGWAGYTDTWPHGPAVVCFLCK
jgi:hypothetical protein